MYIYSSLRVKSNEKRTEKNVDQCIFKSAEKQTPMILLCIYLFGYKTTIYFQYIYPITFIFLENTPTLLLRFRLYLLYNIGDFGYIFLQNKPDIL